MSFNFKLTNSLLIYNHLAILKEESIDGDIPPKILAFLAFQMVHTQQMDYTYTTSHTIK